MSYIDPDTAYESAEEPTSEMSEVVKESNKAIKAYEQGVLSKEEAGRMIVDAVLKAMEFKI